MIIDSHVHAIASDPARYPFSPLRGELGEWVGKVPSAIEDLLAGFEGAGVDGAVIVQAGSAYGYDSGYATDSVQVSPERLSSVCIIDMLSTDGPDRLTYWARDRGAVGLRIMASSPAGADLFDSPPAAAVWERARELGITINIQMFNRDLPRLQRVAERYPEVPVALDHLAHYDSGSRSVLDGIEALTPLAALPNLNLKFSMVNLLKAEAAGITSNQMLGPLVERFGARRLIWGSNFPSTYEPSYARQVDAGTAAVRFLTSEDQALVMGENAGRLWKVGVAR